MGNSTMLHVRIDEQVKAEATEALEAMGLSVSDAVRIFLTRVAADKEFPFTLKVPSKPPRLAPVAPIERAGQKRSLGELLRDLNKDT